ncbi:SH3 domain-containing protein [Oxalobacter vibrioformis]|uniref:SH3 domain-containing protein n=1 Tax=Oxalobacter vibrioformis TaxID=933080 RepID=A0A9E9M0T9_9BURK|nr:SH3 domain-containing protein [Oxalobacter vibrioformis]NLC24004.1 hypothetical protein [Oxalobacter sp.]WAW11155.1 SH3 domain-containing protein [Oxalobacter vibrioformis]
MTRLIRSGLALGLLLMFSAGSVHAFDFGAIGDEPAVLYDAPSYNGIRLFIAPAHMPLEVLLTYESWTKIRDVSGDMAWVESKALGQKRYIAVKTDLARIHESPDTASPVVFQAKKNVILEVVKPVQAGWIHISHQDGQAGFVRVSDVWGV